MKTPTLFALSLITLTTSVRAEDSSYDASLSSTPAAASHQELMLNAFRTPSIGLEYRFGALSVHAGAYTSVVNEGETLAETAAWFAKAGVNVWFLPVRLLGEQPSSFYAGASYLNDFGRDGWGHTTQIEAGFQFRTYEGFFVRLGASALYAPGRDCASSDCDSVKVRPNPGIGWAFPIN